MKKNIAILFLLTLVMIVSMYHFLLADSSISISPIESTKTTPLQLAPSDSTSKYEGMMRLPGEPTMVHIEDPTPSTYKEV